MISVECDGGAERVICQIQERLADSRPLLERIGNYMTGSVIKRIQQGVRPPNAPLTRAFKSGTGTLKDTGALMSSIFSRVQGTDEVLVATDRPYAPILHFGGTIRPRSAKKLAIPASAFTRKLMRRHGHSVNAVLDGLKREGWRIWTRPGAIMGAEPSGGSGPRGGKRYKRPVVLFVRKDSVTIPARPFMYASQADEGIISSMVARYVMEGIPT